MSLNREASPQDTRIAVHGQCDVLVVGRRRGYEVCCGPKESADRLRACRLGVRGHGDPGILRLPDT